MKREEIISIISEVSDLLYDMEGVASNFSNVERCNESRHKLEEIIKELQRPEPQGLDEAIQLVNEYNLRPYRDGNAWCILLGKDIQSGICGFGNTLSEAYLDFLKSYKEYPHPINELLTNCQPNDGLEEAAKESAYSVIPTFPEGDIKAHIRGFKAGAKWDREQGVVEETRIITNPYNHLKGVVVTLGLESLDFDDNEPVIVQIRKKEE